MQTDSKASSLTKLYSKDANARLNSRNPACKPGELEEFLAKAALAWLPGRDEIPSLGDGKKFLPKAAPLGAYREEISGLGASTARLDPQ